MTTIPRESVEFVPVTVTVDGATVTTGVELAVVQDGERPTVWAAPVTLSGQIGVMTGTYAVGTWRVWARVTSNPEVPVVDCGYFRVT